jgi:GNAT superfamily N-acetyltransferase
MQMSRMYSWVRSRQLEGTYPGDRYTGCRVITACRVSRGYGYPPEEAWPYIKNTDPWPPTEPPGLDAIAKKFRLWFYQRVRNVDECKQVLRFNGGLPVHVAVAADLRAWSDAPSGNIPLPSNDSAPPDTHSVLIEGYNDSRQVLKFANSWGAGWGDGGYGYLPYAYFERLLNEAWACFPELGSRPPHDPPREYEVSEWGEHSLTGGVLHGADVYSRRFDENIAWAFGVARDEFLDVEELFVRPEWRNKGFGHELTQSMIERADKESLQIRFWVTQADATQASLGSFARMTAAHGLGFTQSPFRWAQWLVSR